MCPSCAFCGESFDNFCFEEGRCYEVGSVAVCINCLADLKNALDITKIEDRLDEVENDLDEIVEQR
jgi:hypothetical protein